MNCKITSGRYLEMTIAPGETFYAERGALVWCDCGLSYEATMNNKDLFGAVRSALSGESFFLMEYRNLTNEPKNAVFTGTMDGLRHIKLEDYTEVKVRQGAYVASTEKVDISICVSLKNMFAGNGLIFQSITGKGTIFIDSSLYTIEKNLSRGESIEVDEKHIIAFVGISESQIENKYSVRNIVGGEGLATLIIHGPGTLIMGSPCLNPYIKK